MGANNYCYGRQIRQPGKPAPPRPPTKERNTTMIILSATSLTLQFGTDTVLENISFSVEEGDRIGVIGVNGCGKSSLFRMLCHGVGLPGGTEPTAGEVYLAKGRTVGILTQEGAFAEDGEDGNGDQSALEHMYHAFPELLAAETRLWLYCIQERS